MVVPVARMGLGSTVTCHSAPYDPPGRHSLWYGRAGCNPAGLIGRKRPAPYGLPGRMPGCARRGGLAAPRIQSGGHDARAIDKDKSRLRRPEDSIAAARGGGD